MPLRSSEAFTPTMTPKTEFRGDSPFMRPYGFDDIDISSNQNLFGSLI